MIIFLILAALFIIVSIVAPVTKNDSMHNSEDTPLQKVAKSVGKCPPHAWRYTDVNGVSRLKCEVCRMLPGEDTYQPR